MRGLWRRILEDLSEESQTNESCSQFIKELFMIYIEIQTGIFYTSIIITCAALVWFKQNVVPTINGVLTC